MKEFEHSRYFVENTVSYLKTMNWDVDKGELATDILSARLRAKFYGARVMSCRPFVLKILESTADTKVEDIDQKTLQYARDGIRAVVHSTRAFYGVGNPAMEIPIITNVWGTAHAYVLCLNYKMRHTDLW